MLDFIRQNAQIFAQNGSVVATYRTRGTKRYGPYYRVAYRTAGRQCSIYIGRSQKTRHPSPKATRPPPATPRLPPPLPPGKPRAKGRYAPGHPLVATRFAPTASTFADCEGPRLARPAASHASTRPPHTPRSSMPPQPSCACRLCHDSATPHPRSAILAKRHPC